jgi:hypothetical protein
VAEPLPRHGRRLAHECSFLPASIPLHCQCERLDTGVRPRGQRDCRELTKSRDGVPKDVAPKPFTNPFLRSRMHSQGLLVKFYDAPRSRRLMDCSGGRKSAGKSMGPTRACDTISIAPQLREIVTCGSIFTQNTPKGAHPVAAKSTRGRSGYPSFPRSESR